MRTMLLILFLLGLVTMADAEMTNGKLTALCSATVKAEQTICWTYIEGLLHGAIAQREMLCETMIDCTSLKESAAICLPTVSYEKMAATYLQYVKAQESNKEDPAAFNVLIAIKEAYPCKY